MILTWTLLHKQFFVAPCHLQVLHSPGEVVGTCSLDWRKALISQGQPAVLTGELLLGSQSGQRGLDMVGVLSLEVEVGSLSQIVSPSDGKLDRRVFSLSPLPSTSACGPVGQAQGGEGTELLLGRQDRAAGT